MGGRSSRPSAPSPFSNAFKTDTVNSVRINTAEQGSPIHALFGIQRVSVNVIDGFGFKSVVVNAQGGGKGGKGVGGGSGGKKGGSVGQQNYSVNIAFAVCQGPVDGGDVLGNPLRIWSNGTSTTIDHVALTHYRGEDGPPPDPVFASSSPNGPIQNYSGTSYAVGTPMQLGASPALPEFQLELRGPGTGTVGPNFLSDANPHFILTSMMWTGRDNANFPPSATYYPSFVHYAEYCQAQSLAMSYAIERQQPVARWMEEILRLTNSVAVFSGAYLKLMSYGDGTLSGNGMTWTPDLTWQYSFTDNDYLPWSATDNVEGNIQGQDDPVLITRRDNADIYNWMSMEYLDRTNNYDRTTILAFDQSSIDEFGVRVAPAEQAPGFTLDTPARVSLQLLLQREVNIRTMYKFKVGWRHSLLEPMDIVLIQDSKAGCINQYARILQIEEDENGDLTMTAEQIPGSTP